MPRKYREVSKEGSADVSVKVPKNLLKKVDAEAKRRGVSRSAFLVDALRVVIAGAAEARRRPTAANEATA